MPSHLPRHEIVSALRETLAIAEARRAQWNVQPLPLYGDVKQEKQSGDVVKMLRDGQLVAVSATLMQEIVNLLGDDRFFRSLPQATDEQRRARITPAFPM